MLVSLAAHTGAASQAAPFVRISYYYRLNIDRPDAVSNIITPGGSDKVYLPNGAPFIKLPPSAPSTSSSVIGPEKGTVAGRSG